MVLIILWSKIKITTLNKISYFGFISIGNRPKDLKRSLHKSYPYSPGPAWKLSGPFLNEDHFKNSTYSLEEVFHPLTLKALRNDSLFILKEQYASYYGLCYVIQKITPG